MNSVFSLVLCLAGMLFQGPPTVPRENTKKIIDNARVIVWDVTWADGKGSPKEPLTYDRVEIYLGGGAITTTRYVDTLSVATRRPGDVGFEPKGATPGNAGASGGSPARAILIDLKNDPVPPLPNTSGYPDAFPRPGSIKLFENKRVAAWEYTWMPGKPTPIHFHAKDAIVVYLADGAVKSTTLDGQSIVSQISFGLTKFGARNRVHSEELVSGKVRAIIVELK